jgi:four helix bundle protein
MKDEKDLKSRTKLFALSIVRLYGRLPRTTEAQVIGKQILRCGTSVGAQYREAQRAKSDADFINKIQGSLQELDETTYWLEILGEASILDQAVVAPLMAETNELLSIFVTIVKKVKDRKNLHPSSFIPHP